jgi:uncharacterized protein (TIGR02118 family)
MYRVTIVYNHPTDPDAFDAHFSSTHLPLVREVPSVKKFAYGKCESLDGNPTGAYALAQLYFESKDEAGQAFGSPQGQAAAGDIGSFATGGITMLFSDEETVLP